MLAADRDSHVVIQKELTHALRGVITPHFLKLHSSCQHPINFFSPSTRKLYSFLSNNLPVLLSNHCSPAALLLADIPSFGSLLLDLLFYSDCVELHLKSISTGTQR